MKTLKESRMIKPHGSDKLNPLFVMDAKERDALAKEAESLPSIVVCSAAAANAVMLGSGYFNPLTGFMNKADTLSVAEGMKTASGVFFPVPVVNMIQDASAIKGAKRIALRDPNVEGNPVLAVMDVKAIEELTDDELKMITEKVYRTLDPEHPGVAAFTTVGKVLVSGPIKVLNFSYFDVEFPETFRTAYQIRDEMQKLGWNKVVAFQTRNPMHRAHEELCRMAHADVKADGILIHMLLGKLKKGDIPADVRDAAIRKMVELYFPPNTVLITGYGYDMLYAGPREAVLHAVFRQNCGCTHLIVGRDHAGVGSYYGPFDAQTIFDDIPKGSLEIEIYRADHTAFSKKLGKVIMMKDAPPGHTKDDFVLLSGTKVRTMLAAGEALPPEFARPEVAEILMKYYQSEEGK
ncbi:MAG TPA: sulfate adenylyltransferase [Polyangiaceae bacterium]|nr:sulfate adenylyltransferase [Polyangiaceae bacterium]HNZ24742.1 sulfate adenylyltransferase [Polyangiaceae bacterium]HOD24923.1 sulfate adenylyltransferase [Polyangiaceae bacterium]HOE51148.1 sulfate adenylyltransferase [Polyangiaceae bacterium]HOH03622.1 sulfate adenylyltransferase [Polyangiaceae bacterium]